jgi:hypothetical protein
MDSSKKSKKKRKSVEVKSESPKKMETEETEAAEVEEEKPVSKRPKLAEEISLLDKLHGSDPLSAFRELDQLMQAEVVSCMIEF